CTAGPTTPAPASAWRSARRSSSGTAGASGWSRRRARAPPSASPSPGKERTMSPHPLGRPVEILLVEDNPGDVRLTVEALKEGKVHNHMSIVMDGEEAVAFLRRQGKYADAVRPDIILLDLNLPRKDGREVLAEIKADDTLRRIPVVVLTT